MVHPPARPRLGAERPGRPGRFDDDERGAFWDAVTDAALRSTGPGRDLLGTAAAERLWLFDEFELDGRPVVSGLLSVTRLL